VSIRTTAVLVQSVLNTDYDTINVPDLTPYITAGSSITDDVSSNDDQSVMTAAKLTIVETWLAAWAYCCMDQTYQSRNTGKAGGSFKGQTGMNLNSNHYGQTAMMLDTSGYLRAMANKGLVSMVSLAVDYDTQDQDETLVDPEGDISTDF